ncbi:MAG: adenylate/guanylate cyclase domain-containing protein [Armatimonadetes bacterium]|nr:adenylate/guanylate cyclase domain-containing protein [Armatimonadota bacterium]
MKEFPRALVIGLSCAALIVFLSCSLPFASHPLLEGLELSSMDLRYLIRDSTRKVLLDPRIVIVGIDNDTFEQLTYRDLGEPTILWSRHYAAVLKSMREAGVVAVGLDVIQETSPGPWLRLRIQEALDNIRKNVPGSRLPEDAEDFVPDDDQILAQEIFKWNGNIVLGAYVDSRSQVLRKPAPQIWAAVDAREHGAGLVNVHADPDGIIRRQALYLTGFAAQERKEKERFDAFFLSLAVRATGEQVLEKKGRWFLGRREIFAPDGEMLINYAGGPLTFPTLSFGDALRRAQKGDLAWFERNVRGKIVLIGDMSFGNDTEPTPFDFRLFGKERGRTEGSVHGVEVHGHNLNTLLTGRFLSESGNLERAGLVLLLSILTSLICAASPSILGFLYSACLALAYFLVSLYAFNYHGRFIPLAGPSLGIALTCVAMYAYRYVVSDRDKRRIRRLFSGYVCESVAKELLDDPKGTQLGGESLHVTVLFSDIRNFTTMSENMHPQEAISFLNEYLSEMVDVIFRYEGTLNKFIGDGIMAFWGAPAPQKDHAFRAIQAALEMLLRLEELNRKWSKERKAPIRIGIGIHTGVAVIGNVGSGKRMEYTAIGDTVNLASRIEGLNKEFGTSILISEATFLEVTDSVEVLSIGETHVKGKIQDVKILELLGLKGELEHEYTYL